MFAVFNKNSFVDFWLNDSGDKGWIERMVQSKGFERSEVQVYQCPRRPDSSEVWSFDDNKNFLVFQQQTLEVNGQQITSWEVKETRSNILVYDCGTHV
jgi:hypothetical protein